MKNSLLSKSIKIISNYPSINKIFTKIADRGVYFRLLNCCIIKNIIGIST
jgi:hypothetical protein